MIRTERIGHVVLKVRDLERSRRFYTEVLGLDVMNDKTPANLLFLASNRRDHHEIALIEVGPQAGGPKETDVGLAHVAFRLKTQDELRAAYRELKEHDVPIVFTVNHGVTRSVYFLDPDGNQLEVYCDNTAEEVASTPEPYNGMDKLEFAHEDPGLKDYFNDVMRQMQAR